MSKHLGVAFAAALTVAGCSATGSVAPSSAGAIANASSSYHVPHYLPPLAAAKANSTSGITFSYWNGPVLVKPKLYLIFWGYKKFGDPDKVAPLLVDYARAIGGSGHNNIYTQYYEMADSKTYYITNPKDQLGGVWFDNDFPVQNPTDAQVAGEAAKAVAKFGYDAGGSYVVATPHGHNTKGFGTQWCAYHSDTYVGSNLVPYTNLPYLPDAGKSCGAFATTPPGDERAVDEGVTIVEGVEYGDSVTDPSPGTGWYNFTYGEISDPCSGVQNVKFGKKIYTTKPMYSNAGESCVQEYEK